MCELLYRAIKAAKESDHACSKARTLQIQIDGGKENANHTVLAFCAFLVEIDYYDTVEV